MNEPYSTLIVLAEISHFSGLIGWDEYLERLEVADWLFDDSASINDPRSAETEISEKEEAREKGSHESEPTSTERKDPEDPFLYFTTRGLTSRWVFTLSDPDRYPSVPHGHLNAASNAWPKLNPYTGRAFTRKYQEDLRLRLSRNEMRILWNDQAFRAFCRNHVVQYMGTFPTYRFPVSRPLHFPRWRRP
jgi:hypothetical protein